MAFSCHLWLRMYVTIAGSCINSLGYTPLEGVLSNHNKRLCLHLWSFSRRPLQVTFYGWHNVQNCPMLPTFPFTLDSISTPQSCLFISLPAWEMLWHCAGRQIDGCFPNKNKYIFISARKILIGRMQVHTSILGGNGDKHFISAPQINTRKVTWLFK